MAGNKFRWLACAAVWRAVLAAAALVGATTVHAQYQLPSIVLLGRTPASPIRPNVTDVRFDFWASGGTNRVVLLDLLYTDPKSQPHHLFATMPNGLGAMYLSVTDEWLNGTYQVVSATVQDAGGVFVVYNRDGTVAVLNADATGPKTHSLNLPAMDFEVTGAGVPVVLPTLASLARTSGSPLSVGAPATFSFAVTKGSAEVASIVLTFAGPNSAATQLRSASNPGISGTLSDRIPVSAVSGTYALQSVTVSDALGRATTYARDGTVTTANAPAPDVTTHTFNLRALDFVATDGAWPGPVSKITNATRTTPAGTYPGNTVSVDYVIAMGDSAAVSLDVVFADPSGELRHLTTPAGPLGPFTVSAAVASDWPLGAYTAKYIALTDSARRLILYNRDGTIRVDGDGYTGPLTHALNLASLDFQVLTAGPGITTQPQGVNVTAGARVLLSVTANGAPPLSYQWRKDGAAIAGATNSYFAIASAQPADAGNYTVVVSNAAGSTTSASATVAIIAPPGAPVISAQPADQTVAIGASVTFSVTAAGSPAPTYQWLHDGVAIAGATAAAWTIPSVGSADAGTYACQITNSIGSVTSNSARLTISGPSAWLTNVSVRTTMVAGQDPLIVGVTVAGGAKPVLLRAAGPALIDFGLSNAMTDPRLEVFAAGSKVDANDDWESSLANAFTAVGAFPFKPGSKDAALQPTLSGGYTIQAAAVGSGAILVEAYDAKPAIGSPRLTNLSARNLVGSGDGILIAGFSISGSGTRKLLIRAVGPQLGVYGVPNPLVDPQLTIVDGAGKVIATQVGWDASLAAVFSSVGAFPLAPASKDAALTTTLGPGAYTVQVKGVTNGTGQALVEIYEVP